MFKPENQLERSLVKAATEPNHRPRFYRDLLASVIYLVKASEEPIDIRDNILQPGSRLAVQPWSFEGVDWIPAFSSLVRLQQCFPDESRYLRLDARCFLETTRGANVFLNPGLDYGKQFNPAEIESILDGTIFEEHHDTADRGPTKVLIGQPSEPPLDLIDALARLFAQRPRVKTAYLAMLFFSDPDEQPHTLIGMETEGDWNAIVSEARRIAESAMAEGAAIDFHPISADDSGITKYLIDNTTPFYRLPFPTGAP